MENKKIDILFGLVVIAFLSVVFLLFKEYNEQRSNNFKEYVSTITGFVKQKNDRIKVLSNQLVVEEKENADLRSTLSEARNSLDSLSKRLVQVQSPAPAPVAAASVTTPAAATK